MSYDPSHRKPPRQERWPQATPPGGWPSYRDGDTYQGAEQADSRYAADRQGAYPATAGYRHQSASGGPGDRGYRSAVATDTFPPARNGYGPAVRLRRARRVRRRAGRLRLDRERLRRHRNGYGGTGSGYAGTVDGYPSAADGYADAGDSFADTADRYSRTEIGYGQATDEYVSDASGYDWSENGYGSAADGYGGPRTVSPGIGMTSRTRRPTWARVVTSSPGFPIPGWRLPTSAPTRTAGRPTRTSGGKRGGADWPSAR